MTYNGNLQVAYGRNYSQQSSEMPSMEVKTFMKQLKVLIQFDFLLVSFQINFAKKQT